MRAARSAFPYGSGVTEVDASRPLGKAVEPGTAKVDHCHLPAPGEIGAPQVGAAEVGLEQ